MEVEYIRVAIATLFILIFGINRISRGFKQLKGAGFIQRIFEPNILSLFIVVWIFLDYNIPYHWFIVTLLLLGLIVLALSNFRRKYVFYVFNINNEELVNLLECSFNCTDISYKINLGCDHKVKYGDKLMHKVTIKNYTAVDNFLLIIESLKKQIENIRFEEFRFRGLSNLILGVFACALSVIGGYQYFLWIIG